MTEEKKSLYHLTGMDSLAAEKVTPAPEYAAYADLKQRALNAENDVAVLRKLVSRLEADLEECREFIDNYSDVVDGSYGEPAPNRAMQLVNMIDEAIYGPGGTP